MALSLGVTTDLIHNGQMVELVEMDIADLQQQSLWRDITLILLTPLVVFGGYGGV